MIKNQTSNNYYKEKLNLVIEFINSNLDKNLNLEILSKKSHFSPFHFHKITRALLGEPIGTYINRVRLEKAAHLIQYSELSMEQIAFTIGYETPSSLSKQFKNHFGISPSEFRKGKSVTNKTKAIMKNNLDIKKPKINFIDEKQAIYVKLQGSYQQLDFGSAWEKLWSLVKTQKLFTAGIEHIGIPYDDPNITEPDKIRYDACLVIHKPAEPIGEIGLKKLKPGKFACFLYTGSYSHLSEVYDYIFNEWLMNSDYKLRDEPVREKYRNNPKTTEEAKLKTEIFIPIE